MFQVVHQRVHAGLKVWIHAAVFSGRLGYEFVKGWYPGSVLKGVGIGLGATVALPLALAAVGGFLLLFGIGVLEWLWMLPLCLYFRNRGDTETAKGILIVGGIVFLLNASCFGLVLSGRFRIGG